MSESAAIRDLRGRVALAHRLRAAGDLSPTNDSTGAFLERLLAEHDTLTAELAAAREWADQCQLERDAANDSAQDLLNWWQRLKAERDAARDARRNADIYARRFEEQAESAMKERDRLAACVERVRGVRNVLEANHLEAAKVCVDTGYTRGCADTRHLVIEAIDDILAALEGTDAAA